MSGACAISPKGNVVVARRAGEYRFDGTFSVYDARGEKLADVSVPEVADSPGFLFSREGHYGALLTNGYQAIPQSKNRILIISENGSVVGRFETKDWSVQAADLEGHGPTQFTMLGRIDEENEVMVGEGFDSSTLKRITFAIDFKGSFLWRRGHRVDTNACGTTMVLKPLAKRVVIMDFCDGNIDLAELNIKTGELIQDSQIKIDGGQPVATATSVSPDEGRILISLSQQKAGGEARVVILLGPNLETVWKEAPSKGTAFFDSHNRVVMTRDAEVHVGKLQ